MTPEMSAKRIQELRREAATLTIHHPAYAVCELLDAIEARDKRIQELEKDKARLEWYFKLGRNANLRQNDNDLWIVDGCPGYSTSDWRAAIDAAQTIDIPKEKSHE